VNLPFHHQHWAAFACISFIACVLFSVDVHVHQHLNFQQAAILEGQWWRLLTGHLLHTNFNHLWLNVGGLALLWGLHGEHYGVKSNAALILLCGLGTSAGLLFASDITHYVGLSAIIHGVFVWGAVQDIRCGWRSGWILLGGMLAKIGYEQFIGGSNQIVAMIDAPIAVDSHLYGALSGLLLSFVIKGLAHSFKKEAYSAPH